MPIKPPLKSLYTKIGYAFKNATLIEQALSHSSTGKTNNERLEFLGDSILNMIIAKALYHKFPQSPEGELTRLRANLVCGETLAKVALNFQLNDYLHVGMGERKSGGHNRPSVLADALEAMVAALYIEAGFAKTEALLLEWFTPYFEPLDPNQIQKDPKSCLQEYAQSKALDLPLYEITSSSGPDHRREFIVCCTLDGKTAEGRGASRRRAEQDAASQMLSQLEDNHA